MVEVTILAGGGSTRVGRNKALLPVDGIPVIKRVVKAASSVSNKVTVVLKRWDDGGIVEVLKGNHVRFVFEHYRFRSPLIGLYVGLIHSRSKYSLVLPCDAPYLNVDVLKHLVESSEGFDLTIPKWDNGYLEPLCAVYLGESFLKLIKGVEELKGARIQSIIAQLPRIKYIPVGELKKFDDKLLTFYNINTLMDYRKALKLSKSLTNLSKDSVK
ncbi:MAG: molybdenum cofactor guanylyltransferase [Candidatus Brockarchaeota archaeon]|nr:molybdenum cofactor guanylyltransferase [Candidatus Brockarchaeota archaeon]